MPHADPVLSALEAAERTAQAAHEAARAALAAYRGEGSAEPDLMSLRQAEVEFGVSNITARRWATKKHLGVEIEGRLYVKRSLLKSRKRR